MKAAKTGAKLQHRLKRSLLDRCTLTGPDRIHAVLCASSMTFVINVFRHGVEQAPSFP